MRILLIGGSGFIGKKLTTVLTSHNHEVHVVDKVRIVQCRGVIFSDADILNVTELERIIVGYKPDVIINLASKTDANGKILADYDVNTTGVKNIVNILKHNSNINVKIIHFSTQFVIGPKFHNCSCGELHPYTLYGESKAIGEKILSTLPKDKYLIVRPSAVWGPNHPSFAQTLLPFIEKRMIFQSTGATYRSEINVNTLVEELSLTILPHLEDHLGKIIYLANEPVDARRLFDSFSIALIGRRIRRLHPGAIKTLGITAELLTKLGLKLPINRLKMEILTESYLLPSGTLRLP